MLSHYSAVDGRSARRTAFSQEAMVAMLAWIRDITNFGSDPNNVTISGQSGSEAKICALLAMPAAEWLFHRAIIQSGSAVIISGTRLCQSVDC